MNKKILAIVAHPDDEVLGCGGTIAKHSACGNKVGVLFVADGVSSRNKKFLKKLQQKRISNAKKALKILEAESLGFLNFPDNKLDSIPMLAIVQEIEKVINKFKPTIVYTHHYGDLNIDHAIVHRATITACRPLPGSTVKEIYAYEVLSSTEWSLNNNVFIPNYFIDIERYWEKKINAISMYKQEIRSFPHARSLESLESLAISRGSSVGLRKAEAFMTIRCIK